MSDPVKHFICAAAVATALLDVAHSFAAQPTGRLPQGEYRIDSEAVITHSSAAGALTRTQHIEGETGRTTLTDTARIADTCTGH